MRKNQALKKLTIDQLVYYLTFQKFFKDACIDKFQNIFKLQCGFQKLRKLRKSKNCENCEKALDQRNEYRALLTDLSKAFDCLPHDLIVGKLHAYGFSIESLRLIVI